MREIAYTSISGEFEGVRAFDEHGNAVNVTPVPFYLWSFLGGWKPICLKHKLIFQRKSGYYNHYDPTCNDFDDLPKKPEWPKSDLAILTRGFKRIWL
jgi:hypothetical protein